MHAIQIFIEENQCCINLNDISTSMQLPLSVDALLFTPLFFLLLSSSTNLGNLTMNDVDGEVPLNFGSTYL